MKETVGGVLSTVRVMVASQEKEGGGGSPWSSPHPERIQPETSNSAIQPLLAYDSEDSPT